MRRPLPIPAGGVFCGSGDIHRIGNTYAVLEGKDQPEIIHVILADIVHQSRLRRIRRAAAAELEAALLAVLAAQERRHLLLRHPGQGIPPLQVLQHISPEFRFIDPPLPGKGVPVQVKNQHEDPDPDQNEQQNDPQLPSSRLPFFHHEPGSASSPR